MTNTSHKQSIIVSQYWRTNKLDGNSNRDNVIIISNFNFSNCFVLILLASVANLFRPVAASKNSIHYNYNYKMVNQLVRVIYQTGVSRMSMFKLRVTLLQRLNPYLAFYPC